MKKTRVTKLLAVMAMTTGTAVADPRPVAPPPPPAAIAATAESALVAVRALQMISIELARPRTMGSGAPACGNVASRAPRPVSCEPRTEKP